MSESFIHELILKTTPRDERALDICLEMARQLYNAVLTEGFKRIDLMKQSKLYKKALKEYELYFELRKLYKFSDYDLQHYAIKTKNHCEIKRHLDTHVCQKIATRAYLALNKYLKNKGGRPRFKGKNRFSSIEGKSNIAGIKFKENRLEYKKLSIDVVLDKKDPFNIQAHALSQKVKYCRLVRKNIKNKKAWILQLILEGKPLIKETNRSLDKTVGLDIGPSTIAYFQDTFAGLKVFCKTLKPPKLKSLQRKMDRSLRATNKENYNKDGSLKKVLKRFVKSKKYKKYQAELIDLFRKLATTRKRLHCNLANEIIRLGKYIKTEKLSFKAFQKSWGRAIGLRGPAAFLEILKHKAENAGGYLEFIDTRKTALSQICHNCNCKKKKSLKVRWHICDCGIKAQRDLYSAFLACFVTNNVLDIRQAKEAWTGANLLLEQAMLRLKQTAIGKNFSSFGLNSFKSESEQSLVKGRSFAYDTKDDVGNCREPLRVCKDSC